MDGYQVEQVPFYISSDRSILAYNGLAIECQTRPITVIRHELTSAKYQAELPYMLDEVLGTGLDYVRKEQRTGFKVLEIQIDLSEASERYAVLFAFDTANCQTLVQEYRQMTIAKLITAAERIEKYRNSARERRPERFQIDLEPFYMSEDGSVQMFKAVSTTHNGPSIVVKRHELFRVRDKARLQIKLNQAVNAGLAQAKAEHPHICSLLEIHLDAKDAPKRYCLDHVLEALDRDMAKEVEERQREHRPFNERELWSFLAQTASALSFIHAKVRET